MKKIDIDGGEFDVPQVLVAHLGARMHYAVPVLLYEAGILHTFYTDFYCSNYLRSLLENNLRGLLALVRPIKSLSERHHPILPEKKVRYFNCLSIMYYWGMQLTDGSLSKRYRLMLWAGNFFNNMILSKNFPMVDIIYSFLGEGLELALSPRTQHTFKVTEVPISPSTWRLLMEEIRAWPEWFKPGQLDQLKKIDAIDRMRAYQHLKESNLIICPSDFVLNGVRELGVTQKPIKIIPYGFTLPKKTSTVSSSKKGSNNTRIIFVGTLALRKGVQYLWKAIQLLNSRSIEVHLVGGSDLPLAPQKILEQHCRLWGHISRSEVVNHLQKADIFVFPSIAEGSATACYEALAAGLPVITTPNAGSVVRDGVDGFIVPIRDPKALAEKIDFLASNPKVRREMGFNAKERAKEFTRERYGERLIGAILQGWASKND